MRTLMAAIDEYPSRYGEPGTAAYQAAWLRLLKHVGRIGSPTTERPEPAVPSRDVSRVLNAGLRRAMLIDEASMANAQFLDPHTQRRPPAEESTMYGAVLLDTAPLAVPNSWRRDPLAPDYPRRLGGDYARTLIARLSTLALRATIWIATGTCRRARHRGHHRGMSQGVRARTLSPQCGQLTGSLILFPGPWSAASHSRSVSAGQYTESPFLSQPRGRGQRDPCMPRWQAPRWSKKPHPSSPLRHAVE